MIKKTLYFGNPAYLNLANKQLAVTQPEQEKRTIAVEDIGVVVLDHKQITVTQGLIEALMENNVVMISCDSSHLPAGVMLPLVGHSTQTEHIREQIEATQPLKKQLWQQTIKAKIYNQALLLEHTGQADATPLFNWADRVRSGDPNNYEAQAAAYYWANLFSEGKDFRRDREGDAPNNLLNYGYAILRAVIARAIVSAGLLPSVGIFHRNRYNAYCLADDVMEPFRPMVDKLVIDIMKQEIDTEELTKESKQVLLSIPAQDVRMNRLRRPLMVAAAQTTASLCKCFAGTARKIIYPEILFDE
jgi:CRISPR-associated protein Cas1